MAGVAVGSAVIRPGDEGRTGLIGLACVWAGMLILHLALGLRDVWLWVCFPLLFVPWLLFGPDWFDR
jgi:hypothetical protein